MFNNKNDTTKKKMEVLQMKFINDGMKRVSENELLEMLFGSANVTDSRYITDIKGGKQFDYKKSKVNDQENAYSWTEVKLAQLTCKSNQEGIAVLKVIHHDFTSSDEFYTQELSNHSPKESLYTFENQESLDKCLEVLNSIPSVDLKVIYQHNGEY